MKLIDKDALVAEIESKLQKYWKMGEESDALQDGNAKYWGGVLSCLNEMQTLCDALEVKEVDLDKEVDDVMKRFLGNITCREEQLKFAKHFFKLGMRVNNPITAADRGTAEEIIINLKRVEQDYRINLTKEMEWLRNKVKKGE